MMSRRTTIKLLTVVSFTLLSLGFVTRVLANTPSPSRIALLPDQSERIANQTATITTTVEAPRGVLIFEDDSGVTELQIQSNNILTMTLAPGESDSREFKYCNSKSDPNNTTADLIWSIAESFPVAGAEWLVSIDPAGGTIPAPPPGQLQNCQTLTATFDATDLEAQEQPYTTIVTFDNAKPDGDLPDVVLNVELTVLESIDVKVRAFIPCSAVKADIPLISSLFGGDNRSFLYEGGQSSRFEEHLVVSTDSSLDSPIIDRPGIRYWEPTRKYKLSDDDGQQAGTGSADWCRQLIDNPTSPQKKDASIGGHDEPAFQDNSDTGEGVAVRFKLEGGNPFYLEAPPNVDANIVIHLRQQPNDEPEYMISGKHDGFPAYEIYLNKQLVYCHDPIKSGNSPWSLYGDGDIEINTGGWKPINPIACEPIRGIRVNSPIVKPGSYLKVTGNGFSSSEVSSNLEKKILGNTNIKLFANDFFLDSITPNAMGKFEVALDTSEASLGHYTLLAKDTNTNEAFVAKFFIRSDFYPIDLQDDYDKILKLPPNIAINYIYLPVIVK